MLTCSCGAAINVLKDTSPKAAQDLEEKVYTVLMQAWQERNGGSGSLARGNGEGSTSGSSNRSTTGNNNDGGSGSSNSGNHAAAGMGAGVGNSAPSSTAASSNANGKRPAPGSTAAPNKKAKDGAVLKKSTLIVQCPRCNVNVIVPAVKVFQCGACGQYMTIEKQPPTKGGTTKPPQGSQNPLGNPPGGAESGAPAGTRDASAADGARGSAGLDGTAPK